MTKKYRLVKEELSSRTNNNTHPIHEQKTQGGEFDNHQIVFVTPHRRHTALWAIVGIVIVALVAIAILWMNGVSASLTHLNHAVNQNAAAASQQQTQLAAIQTQLNAIMLQLTQIQENLQTFFANLLQAIQRG